MTRADRTGTTERGSTDGKARSPLCAALGRDTGGPVDSVDSVESVGHQAFSAAFTSFHSASFSSKGRLGKSSPRSRASASMPSKRRRNFSVA